MNWDDFRYVLALGRTGTLADASRQLGVHYTSVARRIAALEGELGTRLFDKGRRHQALTSAGEELMRVAEGIEDQIFALDRELLGADARLSGPLRIAALPFSAKLLLPALSEFAELHPDIDLQLTCSASMHSLTRREADVALRITNGPDANLVGRRVATVRFAPFATRGLIERMGDRPMSQWPWLRLDPRIGATPFAAWLDAHLPGWGGPVSIDDAEVAAEQSAQGLVATFGTNNTPLTYPDMVRVGPWLPFAMEHWVLTHPDLRGTARVRAFMRFIGPKLRALFPEPELEDPALWVARRSG